MIVVLRSKNVAIAYKTKERIINRTLLELESLRYRGHVFGLGLRISRIVVYPLFKLHIRIDRD